MREIFVFTKTRIIVIKSYLHIIIIYYIAVSAYGGKHHIILVKLSVGYLVYHI